MSEYKRFIAYFYEYIDGRKQKNAGFAKVELRNGMWRILFRIKTEWVPEPPVQVFGFVRDRGYLLGFLLGNMNNGYEISEEWAYGAENVIGHEKYRFGNLSGIWIQSGDGRKFITVWDDDPIDVEKFVWKIPQEKPEISELDDRERNTEYRTENESIKNLIQEETGEEEVSEEVCEEEPETRSEEAREEEPETGCEEEISEKKAEIRCQEEISEEESYISDLFRKRRHFFPFGEKNSCDWIQIMPCDIVMLQQKGWQAGRSSFLQHGFCQHHHLLFGKDSDGTYIIGVPGLRNQQEEYMAHMFGYLDFKTARIYSCGKVFGYWCRKLSRI